MTLIEQIKELKRTFLEQLTAASTQEEIENIRVTFLGRKGSITQLTKELKNLSDTDKRQAGPVINSLKSECEGAFEEKKQAIETQLLKQATARKKAFDVTAYKTGLPKGSLHPYTHITQLVENIFISMGFEIADGPEVETEYYNFEALNVPANHPARDMQDTFWLNIPQLVMRTHTSNVQIRTMEQKRGPLAIVSLGRAFRHEATDASHDYMFGQLEGLLINKNIGLPQLLATTKTFLQAFFERKDLDIRVRPGYFPFVEPGVEIEMSCPFCTSGCSVCKKGKWIEICGAGLVHPNVLKYGGIDSTEYSGFAFGFGLTRLAMLKYNINDIRLLSSIKIDVLKQF